LPLAKKWTVFNRENVAREFDTYGVYELGDSSGFVVYVGEGRVRQRLSDHLRTKESGEAKVHVRYYRCQYTGSKSRAEQRERVEMASFEDEWGETPEENVYRWKNPPERAKSKSECFIATATYDTPLAAEIQVLRNFRDECLERNVLGRMLVVLYYKVSPTIARRISISQIRQKTMRTLIDPLVRLFRKLGY